VRAAVAGLGCLLLLASACMPPAPRAAEPPPPIAQAPSPTPGPAASPAAVVLAVPSPVAAQPAPAHGGSPGGTVPLSLAVQVGHSGADLRISLDLLLQEQVYLTSAALGAAGAARLDELIAASSSLDQNAASVGQLIGAVKGQPTGQQALGDWRALSADLVSYVQGQAGPARADLAARRASLAGALALGDFSADAANSLLQSRLDAQLSLADSVVAHDPTRAVQLTRAAAAASDDLARPLAAAIAAAQPDQVPPPTDGADVDLRANFAHLIQERVYLLGAAEDAGGDRRSAEQQAATSAADANAGDLGALIASVYGSETGSAYRQRLQAENAAFVAAASGGNRAQAAADVERLRGELDELVAGVNALLPHGLLAQEERAVDQPLLVAADAFLAHDWSAAYARVHDAARQSQRVADSLGESSIDRYPSRFLATPTPSAPA